VSEVTKLDAGWLLPSGLKVLPNTIPLMLSRVPLTDRQAAGASGDPALVKAFREAVAKHAAKLYSAAFNEEQKRRGKPTDLDWWHLRKGAYRDQFKLAWDAYEHGHMPREMLDCAVWLCRNGQMYKTSFPRPAQAFGNYVLSALLSGSWGDRDATGDPTIQGCEIPIPLDRAYLGPGAARKMVHTTSSSWIWEPGLVFDPDTGLYVTREKAGPGAVDLEDPS